MGLPYPGGVSLDKMSQHGDPKAFSLPKPRVEGAPLDMSFSGLKTAVVNILHNAEQRGDLFAEVLGYYARLNRAQTQAHMRRGLRDGAHNVGKTGFSGKIDTIGRYLYAGYDKLAVALFIEFGRLLNSRGHRQTAHPASRVWDYTVRAEIDAAVLNF